MQIFKSSIILHGAQIYAKKYRSVPYFHDILRVKKNLKIPPQKLSLDSIWKKYIFITINKLLNHGYPMVFFPQIAIFLEQVAISMAPDYLQIKTHFPLFLQRIRRDLKKIFPSYTGFSHSVIS